MRNGLSVKNVGVGLIMIAGLFTVIYLVQNNSNGSASINSNEIDRCIVSILFLVIVFLTLHYSNPDLNIIAFFVSVSILGLSAYLVSKLFIDDSADETSSLYTMTCLIAGAAFTGSLIYVVSELYKGYVYIEIFRAVDKML